MSPSHTCSSGDIMSHPHTCSSGDNEQLDEWTDKGMYREKRQTDGRMNRQTEGMKEGKPIVPSSVNTRRVSADKGL